MSSGKRRSNRQLQEWQLYPHDFVEQVVTKVASNGQLVTQTIRKKRSELVAGSNAAQGPATPAESSNAPAANAAKRLRTVDYGMMRVILSQETFWKSANFLISKSAPF